ncbi:hypothetical protein UR09_00020 [Candidatus Nitromaritima sp. SCGC AAA799-A02]|nr:hypothetical protein UR09_00020 [Candidatus Nitromaritima sp. SCGC AAA799-A02]
MRPKIIDSNIISSNPDQRHVLTLGKRTLDILILKFDSFDRPSFSEEVLAYSKNSLIAYWDFEKFSFEHKPDYIRGLPRILKYPKPGRSKWFRMISLPFLLAYHTLLLIFCFGYICVRYRPEVCWTENTFVAMFFGFLKKLGFCKHTIYFIGDWLVSERKQGLQKYFANNIIWGSMDYFAASLSDLVINISDEISRARETRWGRNITKRECSHFPPTIKINPNVDNRPRNNICFLGQVREDSGLNLLIPLLRPLNEKLGIKLKLIGTGTPHRKILEKQIRTQEVEDCVKLYDWAEIKNLPDLLGDCFCGLNLLTSLESYSVYTVPGKLIQYLQMLVPVLITKNNGAFTEVTLQHDLGMVIEPNAEAIIPAIETLMKNHDKYRQKIINFTENQRAKTVKDYIELSKRN